MANVKTESGSLWRKKGGGVLILRDGRKVKRGDTFHARRIDIPKAFLSSLEVIESETTTIAEKTKKTNDVYKIVEVAKGFYNIVDTNGKKLCEKNLRKGPAEQYLKQLLAGSGDNEQDENQE